MFTNVKTLQGYKLASLDGEFGAPEYSDALMLTREYEEGLHGHYRRPGYWSEEPTS